jgi:DNA-binding NarL/FixJ family response regulator
MPGMNGIDLIKRLKFLIQKLNIQNKDKLVQIVEPTYCLITSYFSQNFNTFVNQYGLHGVYEKPMKTSELKKIIDASHRAH